MENKRKNEFGVTITKSMEKSMMITNVMQEMRLNIIHTLLNLHYFRNGNSYKTRISAEQMEEFIHLILDCGVQEEVEAIIKKIF